jgi:hypothetical protein
MTTANEHKRSTLNDIIPLLDDTTCKSGKEGFFLHPAFSFHFWIDFLSILQESGSTACSRYRPMAIGT